MSCLLNNNQVNFFQESTPGQARTIFEMNTCVVNLVNFFQESTPFHRPHPSAAPPAFMVYIVCAISPSVRWQGFSLPVPYLEITTVRPLIE